MSHRVWQPETPMRVRLEQVTFQSVREYRALVIATSCVMMCHYACLLLENEPPTLKMEWAQKRPVCSVWSEVVLSLECHFTPAVASVRPCVHRVARSRGKLEAKRCVQSLITTGGTQTRPLIWLNESRCIVPRQKQPHLKVFPHRILNVHIRFTLKTSETKKRAEWFDFSFKSLAMQCHHKNLVSEPLALSKATNTVLSGLFLQ